MKPETKFSAKVQKRLRELPKTFVIRIQAGSIVGIPDLIICRNGYFFAWELKVGDNKLTPIQEHTIDKIAEAGGGAWEVRPENLETSINRMITLSGGWI
jgi:hypothetical protein